VLNPGAVFGIGPGQRGFFVGFTVLALVFGMVMFAKWTTAARPIRHAAIGLLIGGGLGNLYDRPGLRVRARLHPSAPDVHVASREIWPYVSNLADLFLLIGIVMPAGPSFGSAIVPPSARWPIVRRPHLRARHR